MGWAFKRRLNHSHRVQPLKVCQNLCRRKGWFLHIKLGNRDQKGVISLQEDLMQTWPYDTWNHCTADDVPDIKRLCAGAVDTWRPSALQMQSCAWTKIFRIKLGRINKSCRKITDAFQKLDWIQSCRAFKALIVLDDSLKHLSNICTFHDGCEILKGKKEKEKTAVTRAIVQTVMLIAASLQVTVFISTSLFFHLGQEEDCVCYCGLDLIEGKWEWTLEVNSV